jgi:hypothetical protein
MDEDMNPNEAKKEFPLVIGHRSNISLRDPNRMSIM